MEPGDSPFCWPSARGKGPTLDLPADQSDDLLMFGRNGQARPVRGLARFLYSSNPFYILSADLVFVGLRLSFGAGGSPSRTAALLIGLGGYTLLLATTACVLIRLGDLWDDLRSLLLLVVMMLLAIAMSSDDVMAAEPRQGVLVCLGGFLFAAVVTEAVLRAIRLRLAGWYRVAYYLIMALMFLYPLALAPYLAKPDSAGLQWALFAFSPLAGLALTTLVPAARRGRAYVVANGSPWRWPLYPWSLFVVMTIGLAIRCPGLCVSFHFVGGHETIFGPYFLVPIGLAASLVWLEIGIASSRRSVMFMASASPLALSVLALTGHRYDAVYQHFLELLMESLGGSPAFLSLIAATVFAAYAARRGAPLAWDLASVNLVMLSVVSRRTVEVFDTVSPRWPPLAAAGVVLWTLAWRRNDSSRAFVASAALVAAITLGVGEFFPDADRGAIALHLIVLTMLAVGAIFDDFLARLARACGALVLLLVGITAAVGLTPISHGLPAGVAAWYPAFVATIACGYGFLLRDPTYLEAAFICLAAWLGWSTWQSYAQLRKTVAGLDQIMLGFVFFLTAMAISLRKVGLRPGRLSSPLLRWLAVSARPAWGGRQTSRLRR